jgi:hypothetical protein
MAIPVCQEIIDSAAVEFGDQNKAKITNTQWLLFYNEAREQMTRDYHILEQDATHDITANEDRIAYPDDCNQMIRWRYNPTPADPEAWRESEEAFEDEFRSIVALNLPRGDTGFKYWARPQFFHITPQPTVTVPGGGLLTYWKMADRVEAGNELTTEFDLPLTLRRLVTRLMIIFAKETIHRYEEADRDRRNWQIDMENAYGRIEDRSDDKRPRLRLKTARQSYYGMN